MMRMHLMAVWRRFPAFPGWKKALWISGAVALVVVVYFGRYFIYPDIAALKTRNPSKSSFMNYRERQWKKKGESRTANFTWIPYERISPNLIKAVVVSEDAKFWRHNGFDFAEMKNAALENLEQKRFKFGASTISQQLVKNLYLQPSKNVLRKGAEAILTWRLERTLSKKRILEIYLNVVEWGDGIFGVERAAHHYYGKPASELSVYEAARLAVVLPSPLRYNPTGTSSYIQRQSEIIVKRMFPERVQRDIATTVAEPVMIEDTVPVTDSVIVLQDNEVMVLSAGDPVDTDQVVPEDSGVQVPSFSFGDPVDNRRIAPEGSNQEE